MTLGERAVELHQPGTNCAQCVLRCAGDFTHMDETTATNIAAGFGRGVQSGEICGAISGAVMALGLCGKANLTKSFVEDFQNHYGTCRCYELKMEKHIPCDDLIEYSANKLEEVLLDGTI